MKYRMYIDEVGSPGMGGSLNDPNDRYLSLTGVIFELDYVRETVFPAVEDLKRRFFGSHPDEPIILHRTEIVRKKYPFHRLHDPSVHYQFDEALLSLLERLDYCVISVVIDKLEHHRRYQWKYEPYHYCLTILIERFVMYLEGQDTTGDILAESRGGKEDQRLKKEFTRILTEGTGLQPQKIISADRLSQCLTSKQLKVKTKGHNIAGLQLADLIAYPSYRAMLAQRSNQTRPADFGGRIVTLLEATKYYRTKIGVIEGCGQKWLP